jgi:hypothetical protein
MTIARFEKAYGYKDVVCFWLHDSALAVCATFLAREPLYDLDIVSSRILGREQAGSISSSGWHKLDRAIKRLIEGIHLNGHALPNVHLSELSLLKVRGRPDIVNLDHHDELLPLRNSAPDFRAALARDPVDRGHNGTQKAVARLGRWDFHLIKRKNRPITHARYDGH